MYRRDSGIPKGTKHMHAYRSHSCAALTKANVGETVRLSGWVHRIRDHGGVLFIDLRDHYGVTQVLCDPDSPVFKDVEKVRSEWCIRIDGNVKARDESLIRNCQPARSKFLSATWKFSARRTNYR